MQQRAIETRRRILESAVQLFSQRGLNGVTIDEIATDAKVNKQRIYAYFDSKNNLFSSALLNVFENSNLFSRETLNKAKRNPEHLTGIIVQGFLKIHRTNPALWRLLSWANLEGKECASILNQVRKEDNETLRDLFECNVRNGVIRPVKFEVWLFTLLAVTCFRFSNRLTLAHTLGWDPAEKSFENELISELERVFSGKTC